MSDVFVQLRQEDGTAIFPETSSPESLTGPPAIARAQRGYRYDLRPTAPKFEITGIET
jgi:hypothetical protein